MRAGGARCLACAPTRRAMEPTHPSRSVLCFIFHFSFFIFSLCLFLSSLLLLPPARRAMERRERERERVRERERERESASEREREREREREKERERERKRDLYGANSSQPLGTFFSFLIFSFWMEYRMRRS